MLRNLVAHDIFWLGRPPQKMMTSGCLVQDVLEILGAHLRDTSQVHGRGPTRLGDADSCEVNLGSAPHRHLQGQAVPSKEGTADTVKADKSMTSSWVDATSACHPREDFLTSSNCSASFQVERFPAAMAICSSRRSTSPSAPCPASSKAANAACAAATTAPPPLPQPPTSGARTGGRATTSTRGASTTGALRSRFFFGSHFHSLYSYCHREFSKPEFVPK